MKKIKILHVLRTTQVGGAEINLLNLLQVFSPERFEMHVGYCCGGELEDRLRHTNAKLFKYSGRAYKVFSLGTFSIILRMVAYIFKNKIDLVHTHTSNAHIWGGMAAKITGRKIVEHVHDFRYSIPVDYKRRLGQPNKQFKHFQKIKNFSDIVIVLTQEYYTFLIEKKLYPPTKVLRIPNGIFIPTNRNSGSQLDPKDDLHSMIKGKRVVFTSCRASREKNVGLIMKIAPKVKIEIPNVIFIIAGAGADLESLRNECKESNLETYVKFVGFQSNISGLLEASHVYLLPSLLELHSIAIIEAMSRRVPVVISRDVGSNGDMINNWTNGVLLDPFSETGWAEAIVRLLKDENLRRALGEAGYKTCCQEFDIADVTKKLENIYVQLTNI